MSEREKEKQEYCTILFASFYEYEIERGEKWAKKFCYCQIVFDNYNSVYSISAMRCNVLEPCNGQNICDLQNKMTLSFCQSWYLGGEIKFENRKDCIGIIWLKALWHHFLGTFKCNGSPVLTSFVRPISGKKCGQFLKKKSILRQIMTRYEVILQKIVWVMYVYHFF